VSMHVAFDCSCRLSTRFAQSQLMNMRSAGTPSRHAAGGRAFAAPRTVATDTKLRSSAVEVFDLSMRWLVLPGLIYRFLAAPGSFIGFLGHPGMSRPVVWLVLAALLGAVVLNGVLVAFTVWVRTPSLLGRPVFLLTDLVIAVGVNLAIAAALPLGTFGQPYGDMAWFYLQGSAALAVAYFGIPGGVLVVASGVPIQLLMGALNHVAPEGLPWSLIVARCSWLAVVSMSAMLVLPLYRIGGKRAIEEGLLLGRTLERSEQLRAMHDTVLQTLQAIALRADSGMRDAEGAPKQLHAVRESARRQAEELREELNRASHDSASLRLIDVLRESASRSATAGVKVRLDLRDLTDGDRNAVARQATTAIRAALGEALANVWKHAGVSSVVVSAASLPDRVEVTVTDRGRGAILSTKEFGFGIRESMVARLRDIGGGAVVWSRPHAGTVVVLWMPREAYRK
jgi:signal transduction histidine kinase